MKRILGFCLILFLLVGSIGLYMALKPDVKIEHLELTHPATSAPAMCPWRSPQADMQAFFPNSTGYTQRFLTLSSLRLQIAHKLGSRGHMESNGFYCYDVVEGVQPAGVILTQRTAGEYGAIEVVMGLNPTGRIAGVKLQRLREPEAISNVITAPEWLAAFRGKTADSPLQVGSDLPSVPPSARISAEAVATAVRTLLIEYDAASNTSPKVTTASLHK